MKTIEVLHQFQPWIGQEERNAIAEYLDSGGWLTEFEETYKFEELLAAYGGSNYAIAVSNGTVSLYAALRALGIGPQDEVIVPDFTMIASANAVVLTGATPVFVDISADNLCLDLDLAEKAINRRTRAIMLVSLNGRAPDMQHAVSLAARYRLFLIEDAAQSLGSWQARRHLGTFGRVGSFSLGLCAHVGSNGEKNPWISPQEIPLLLETGEPKTARLIADGAHMGRRSRDIAGSGRMVMEWLRGSHGR